jgi:hypothetical protein
MRPSHSTYPRTLAYRCDATASRALSGRRLPLLAAAFVSAGALASPGAWTLSFDGYGPIHIGMTVRDAEQALHFKLTAESLQPGATPDDGCEYFENEQKLPALRFMTGKGRILRIDVGDRRYRTSRGARVGMTLIFETDGKLVTELRAGEREPVSWIEGCQ